MRRSTGRTGALAATIIAAVSLVVAGAGVAAADATASPTPTGSTHAPCPDPAFGPTGVTASAQLTGTTMDAVQATITWPPLVQPQGCSPGSVDIAQISPAGPTITVPDTGRAVITGLRTLTAYTWQLRYVSGTVSTWTTVSVGPVLPLDYCMGLPGPRPIVATTPSPTSVHLEWGRISYPSECSGTLTVRNVTAGTPAVTVDRSQTGVTIDGLAPGSTSTWLVTFVIQLGSVTVTQPGASGPTCTATAHLDSVWGNGLVTTVTVRNTSAVASTRWSASWTPPAGVGVDNTWNAQPATGGGTFTASSTPWNGTLAPGATTTFGFLAHTPGGTPAVPELACTAS